ncbi:MAG: FecR domain-containing protein, partial [Blastomonas sp.]|nr:FecR domain-containing protein [Blastomonas sp.]
MARRLFVVRVIQVLAALVLLVIALPASAFADDWLVTKLRGEVLQLVGDDWAPLVRGDVVPDDRAIRTMASGRATLQRGGETIEIAANTQIRIFDTAGGKRFTTVQQHFGTVAIEAEVRNVRHFAVQTPYLAAVVKGTRFEVKTSAKQSQVKVQRGLVAVEDTRSGASALIKAGQTAAVTRDGAFTTGGKGGKAQIVNSAGEPVDPAAAARGSSRPVPMPAAGGQGAPLVPVFHRALAEAAVLEGPVDSRNIRRVSKATRVAQGAEPTAYCPVPCTYVPLLGVRSRPCALLDARGGVARRGVSRRRPLPAPLLR